MSLLMDALNRAGSSKQPVIRQASRKPPQIRSFDFNLEAKSEPILTKPFAEIECTNPDLAASETPATSSKLGGEPPCAANKKQGSEVNRQQPGNPLAIKKNPRTLSQRRRLLLSSLCASSIGIAAYSWWYQNLDAVQVSNAPHPINTESLLTQPVPSAPFAETVPPAIPILPTNTPSTVTLKANPERSIKQAQHTSPNHEDKSQPVRLIRTQPEVNPAVQRGYANLQGNLLAQARHDYEQALRNDPNQLDALLGLAAIAQRQGRHSDAEHYQQRALVAAPNDTGVQAALLGSGSRENNESRLKILLSGQPESAELNFALGNVYAKQARWSEAQEVYFNAVTGDNDNPDYLFNLAVSLDQLHQPKLAAQHYRQALVAAEKRPAAFDHERTHKRLSQLSP